MGRDPQLYIRQAYELLLDRTYGSPSIVHGRRLLRPCESWNAMEQAEQHFSAELAAWRREGRSRLFCAPLETVVLLIRCAMMTEWHAIAELADLDTEKSAADLEAARRALALQCLKHPWMVGARDGILS